MIFQDFPGPGIFKKKIQDFPGGAGTLCAVKMLLTSLTNSEGSEPAERLVLSVHQHDHTTAAVEAGNGLRFTVCALARLILL